MRRLNYAHLLYFHTVAREGSVVAAAEILHVTPQTISGQIKLLEVSIGQALFERSGRGLVLSDTGRLVQEYADDIFARGDELARRLGDESVAHAAALRVGIVDSVPKLVACRVLGGVLDGALESGGTRLVCREGGLESLLAEIAVHRLDLILSDRPVPAGLAVRARNHPLGSSGVALFAPEADAARLASGFPASLDGVALLLPRENSALRRQIDHWLDEHELHPRLVAEFDDGALMKAFGQAGLGVFPSPLAIADGIALGYGAHVIGTVDGVAEDWFVIAPERRHCHPAVDAIVAAARRAFAADVGG